MTRYFGEDFAIDAPEESGGSSVQLLAELAEWFELFDAAQSDEERVELRKAWYGRHPGVLIVRPDAGNLPGDEKA